MMGILFQTDNLSTLWQGEKNSFMMSQTNTKLPSPGKKAFAVERNSKMNSETLGE